MKHISRYSFILLILLTPLSPVTALPAGQDGVTLVRLVAAVRAAAPINNIVVGAFGDPKTVQIDFQVSATPAQRALAQAAIDTFDWSQAAQDAADLDRARADAQAMLVGKENTSLTLRAIVSTLLDEINTLRTELKLPPRPATDAQTSIDAVISTGKVDTVLSDTK